MTEVTVAAALLAVLFSLTGRLIVRVRAAERLTAERETALQAVENLMERAAARATSGGDVRDLIKSEVASELPDRQLAIDIGDADSVGLSPVTIQVTWTDAAGQKASPVSLTAWLPIKGSNAEAEGGR
jgi:hypothetical protein